MSECPHLVPLLRRVVQRRVAQLVLVVDDARDLVVVLGRLGLLHEEVEALPAGRHFNKVGPVLGPLLGPLFGPILPTELDTKMQPKMFKMEVYACTLFKCHFGLVFGPIFGWVFGPKRLLNCHPESLRRLLIGTSNCDQDRKKI